MIIINHW